MDDSLEFVDLGSSATKDLAVRWQEYVGKKVMLLLSLLQTSQQKIDILKAPCSQEPGDIGPYLKISLLYKQMRRLI